MRAFVQQHGGKTQAQLALLWGDNVTQQNISDALGKIGVSRKKKRMGTLERDDHLRQEFQERLKTKGVGQIVYVDEGGIDNP